MTEITRNVKETVILAANATPKQGGQGLNLQHMIEGLREAFEIALFCRGSADNLDAELVPPSALSEMIGRLPVVRRFRDWQNYWSDRQFDSYVAKRMRPAAIFQGVTGQCCESMKAARQMGCRTVLDSVTTHVLDFVEHQQRECAKFGTRPAFNRPMIDRALEEYRHADLIRVMSEYARRTFLERGFPEDQVINAPPPFDVAEFPQAGFEEPLFRVSFVGLLEPWKGFHYLIEAFHALDLPDSELILWGGPGSRGVSQYLRSKMSLNPRIKIRPVGVRQVGLDQVYGKSSVLVHPSLSDGFGYVVGEAMASGIPVIVTRNTGAVELVVDGENGYVVPAGDAEAIRDRLAYLSQHPAALAEMGRAARRTMENRPNHPLQHRYAGALRNLAAGVSSTS